MSLTDRQFSDLMAAAKAGDANARGELVRTYVPQILGRVRKGLSPELRKRYDSIDVVQSVTADLLGTLPHIEDRGAGAFCRWIQVAAENKIRSKGRRMRTKTGALREVSDHAAAGRPGADPTPDEVSAEQDELRKLFSRLGSIDSASREIIRLRLREGRSYRQIAEVLGASSADAARMKYRRAVARLRANWLSEERGR